MIDSPSEQAPRWSPATRVAFRFVFVYCGLYVLTTQMLSGLFIVPLVPVLGQLPPFRNLVVWVGHHVLQLATIPIQPSGSGDTLLDWVHAFTLLLLAVIATIVWSLRAGDRTNHARLYKWFRLLLRFAVATTMFSYGFAKVIPLQMPTGTLARLVEPFGDFSPMGVLWYSIGAAPAYEMFVGWAEVFAGVLLIVPITSMFGALVTLMDAIGIFALNMTYDVPVKLFSFHLIVFALILLAPNVRTLLNFLLLQRAAAPRPEPPLARGSSAQRKVVIAQVAFGAIALLVHVVMSVQAWSGYGGGAPKSPLYGVWRVAEMQVDGVVRPPLTTDTTRWRHVVFQQPTSAMFQRMNDKLVRYTTTVDAIGRTLRVAPAASPKDTSTLTLTRPSPETLILDGTMGGHAVRLQLELRKLDEFLLRSRGFHWVQEFPFNR